MDLDCSSRRKSLRVARSGDTEAAWEPKQQVNRHEFIISSLTAIIRCQSKFHGLRFWGPLLAGSKERGLFCQLPSTHLKQSSCTEFCVVDCGSNHSGKCIPNLFSCVKQSKKFHQHSNQSLLGNASKKWKRYKTDCQHIAIFSHIHRDLKYLITAVRRHCTDWYEI